MNQKSRLDEARAWAKRLVDDPEYQLSVRSRMIGGVLPSAVEVRLLDYAYGRPIETLEVSDPDGDLRGMSQKELAALLSQLETQLKKVYEEPSNDSAPGVTVQ